MLPPELFDFDDLPHPLILDMAASPGGTDHPFGRPQRGHGFYR